MLNRSPEQIQNEAELKRIWNKWTNVPVPPKFQEQCELAYRPIHDYFVNFIHSTWGNLSQDISYKKGASLGDAVGRASRGCFMVGMEYGSQYRGKDISTLILSEEAKKALPCLNSASELFDLNLKIELAELFKAKRISEKDMLEAAKKISKMNLEAMINCFRSGFEFGSSR